LGDIDYRRLLEDPERQSHDACLKALVGRLHRIVHVHIADHPGRNGPGSGALPLKQKLAWLEGQGYAGAVGLEFRPTGSTADALKVMRGSLGN
jgi:hydroxypyruvate isomerase